MGTEKKLNGHLLTWHISAQVTTLGSERMESRPRSPLIMPQVYLLTVEFIGKC